LRKAAFKSKAPVAPMPRLQLEKTPRANYEGLKPGLAAREVFGAAGAA
jgi:hypothetical protein